MYTRCKSCNKVLSSQEYKRKYRESKLEIGLCNGCFSDVKDSIRYTSMIDDVKKIIEK